MRVLLTADTVGGVWTYAVDLAAELEARGVEVTLATMGGQPPDHPDGLDLRESDYALEWMPDPWADVEEAGEWLIALADEVEPDVVHLNGYAHAALPWRAPVVVGAHSDVASWYAAVRGEEPPPEFDRYRREVRRGLAAADLVLAPTRWMLGQLELHHSFTGQRRVVSNGRATPAVPRAKEPFVVGVGRLWDAAKGLAALDSVASRLPWPVLVAGEGGEGARAARALGRVRPSDVSKLVARGTIFCSPALYEPFGLAALEAAQAGCALVLSELPSLREVWSDAALYVPPRDEAALERALRRLIEDDGLRAEYARRARARATCYSSGQMAERTLEAYESVVPARV